MPLSWGIRLRIAIGITRAWKNLKAVNVLLDEDLTPHICDCRLAVLKPLTINSVRVEEHLKMEMEIPCSNKIKFITACSFSNDSFEDIMKAQVSVIKASATLNIQAFKIKKSVSISFRMTQVHKMAKDHMMMIKDYDWMMISKKLKDHIQVKLKPKSLKFTASDSQDTDQ
ncbi:protein STRUBBELIG-receptor family 2 [Tanacetum coccineum]